MPFFHSESPTIQSPNHPDIPGLLLLCMEETSGFGPTAIVHNEANVERIEVERSKVTDNELVDNDDDDDIEEEGEDEYEDELEGLEEEEEEDRKGANIEPKGDEENFMLKRKNPSENLKEIWPMNKVSSRCIFYTYL